jgi:hypothetical protein
MIRVAEQIACKREGELKLRGLPENNPAGLDARCLARCRVAKRQQYLLALLAAGGVLSQGGKINR